MTMCLLHLLHSPPLTPLALIEKQNGDFSDFNLSRKSKSALRRWESSGVVGGGTKGQERGRALPSLLKSPLDSLPPPLSCLHSVYWVLARMVSAVSSPSQKNTSMESQAPQLSTPFESHSSRTPCARRRRVRKPSQAGGLPQAPRRLVFFFGVSVILGTLMLHFIVSPFCSQLSAPSLSASSPFSLFLPLLSSRLFRVWRIGSPPL